MAYVNVLDEVPFAGWELWEQAANLIPPNEAALILSDVFYECYFFNKEKSRTFPASLFLMAPILQLYFLEQWARRGWELPREQIPCNLPTFQLLHFLAANLVSLRQQEHCSRLEVPWLEHCMDEWYRLLEQPMISRRHLWELGRAKLIYEELWSEISGEFALGSNRHLSVDSLWLFSLGLLGTRGYIRRQSDLTTHMRFTPEETQDLVMRCTANADELLASRSYLQYPGEFWSPFLHAPILRLPNGSLFAPEPLRLMNSFEYLVSYNANKRYTNEGLIRKFSRNFGKVFENYIGVLLKTFEKAPAIELFDEFLYHRKPKEEVASPDFFLHCAGESPKTLIFECKAARYLEPNLSGKVGIASFHRWIGKLLGETKKRGLFEQGARFLADWRMGRVYQPHCNIPLPHFSDEFLYVIVSYTDLPIFINWPKFRRECYLFRGLPLEEQFLTEKTIFLSMSDLEKAGNAACAARRKGECFDLVEHLRLYLEELHAPIRFEGEKELLGGFGDYCMKKHSATMSEDDFLLTREGRKASEASVNFGFR